MLAWHIRRHKDNPAEDESKWPTAPVLGLLHAEVHLTKEMLETMAVHMSQVPGVELTHEKSKDHKKFKAILEAIARAAPEKKLPE